jgi:hypothetical protein
MKCVFSARDETITTSQAPLITPTLAKSRMVIVASIHQKFFAPDHRRVEPFPLFGSHRLIEVALHQKLGEGVA